LVLDNGVAAGEGKAGLQRGRKEGEFGEHV
jgi:hypothetical protein